MSRKPKDPLAQLRPLEGIDADLAAAEELPDVVPEDKSSTEMPAERDTGGFDGDEHIVQEGPRISAVHLTTAELEEQSKLTYLRSKSGRGFEQVGRSAVDSLIGVAPDTRPVCALHNIVGCQCLDSDEVLARRAERAARGLTDASMFDKERRQIIELRAYGYARYNKLADEMEAWIQERDHPKPKTETDIISDTVAAKLEARGVRKPNYKITKRRPRLKNIFTDKTKNLRLEFKYEPRQLAALLDRPEFNRLVQVPDPAFADSKEMRRWKYEIEHGKGKTRYETRVIKEFASVENTYVEVIDGVARTITRAVLPAKQRNDVNLTKQVLVRPGNMDQWYAMRADCPRIKMPFIEPRDAAFYRAYANRNLSPEKMQEKFGQVEEESIIALENRIIKHALHLKLLLPPPFVSAALAKRQSLNNFERDLDEGWQRETRAIGKHISWAAIGGATGGRIHTSGHYNKNGQLTPLNSFETNPDLKGGWSAEEANTESDDGAMHDDFGDESGS